MSSAKLYTLVHVSETRVPGNAYVTSLIMGDNKETHISFEEAKFLI